MQLPLRVWSALPRSAFLVENQACCYCTMRADEWRRAKDYRSGGLQDALCDCWYKALERSAKDSNLGHH